MCIWIRCALWQINSWFSAQMGSIKVNLGVKMRVKINGERVTVPYTKENVVWITKTSDSVLVKTYLGVKVVWDGNSFLEVSVPTHYKGRREILFGFRRRNNYCAFHTRTTRFGEFHIPTCQFVRCVQGCIQPLVWEVSVSWRGDTDGFLLLLNGKTNSC